VADVLLSDGSTVQIRQIEPSDADAIVAMHARFSERTRYLRYFSPYPRIPQRDLERFVNVDHRDREAYVVASGEDLIAVGRYERLGPQAPDAEVAFVVADDHQGRGIGSVLLEHLAAAAERAGVSRFVAEVLPENGAMLRVFADAGYQVNREYADGVVHLAFPVAPTDRSREVQAERERHTEARSVARLLKPRQIAVYGASRSGTGVGAALLRHLSGYAHPVRRIDRDASLASLADGYAEVDLAVVAVPPAEVLKVVADCAGRVAGLLVVTDLDPADRHDLVRAARAAGMRVIGPASLGVAAGGMNATLAPRLPAPGRVGLFSQSGTLGLVLLAEAERRGVGISSFVSVGQRGDVSGNDLIQYWADDPDTDVVLMYLETFGNPRKFARLARSVGRAKPIVILSGRTGLGSILEPSAMQALGEHSGVIQVETVAELFDVGLLLAGQPLPAGNRVGVVSNAPALTALAASALTTVGLRPGPVGAVSPSAADAEFTAALETILRAEDTDALLVVVAPPLPTGAMELSTLDGKLAPYARAVAEAAQGFGKPIVTSFLYGQAPSTVPSYPSIEEAVRALAQVSRRAAWLREPLGVVPPSPVPVPPTDLSSVEEMLAAYGIDVVPHLRARGVAAVLDAVRSFDAVPVAFKVVDRPHRIDLGAVRLDVTDRVEAVYRDLETLFGADVEVYVQPMVAPGVPCVVEAADDPAFGPVVGFGLGGVVAELVGDRAWRAAPLTDRDAFDLVRTPRAADLLTGAAGGTPVQLAALEELLLRVGHIADEVPRLRRLVLNPVLARPDGFSVLHARGEFAEPAPRPDTGPRLLPPAR
jgi:acyl-CoA synthetase (NDP forming)/GNAT superfamily N-acetyltransferase